MRQAASWLPELMAGCNCLLTSPILCQRAMCRFAHKACLQHATDRLVFLIAVTAQAKGAAVSKLLPDSPGRPVADPSGGGVQAFDWLYHFVTALELAPAVAVHSMDRAGIIRFWNHASEELYGIRAIDAVGRAFRDVVFHPGRQTVFDDVFATIAYCPITDLGRRGP